MSNTITIAGCKWPIANGCTDLRGTDLRDAYLEDAYLQGADLQGADLRGAVLQGADLQGAYLQDADLQGADLYGADLQGAYLQDANLKGADLRGANGVYELDMADPRGYRPLAVAHIDGWRISSGCRWFAVQEAIAHWSNPEHEEPGIASRYIRAINALPECPNVDARK